MRALITGATGFIGRRVVEHLVRVPGISIVAVSKGGGRVGHTDVLPLDLEHSGAVREFQSRQGSFHAVFHFSARVPGSFLGKEADDSLIANIQQTQAALTCLAPLGHIVYASSTAVYGSYTAGIRSEAGTWPRPDNSYAIGKYAGELLCLAAAAELKGSASILRICAPYGPGQRHRTVIGLFVEQAIKGQGLRYHGTGKRTQDFTYVDDIARAAVQAWQRRVHDVVNVASGDPISMRALSEIIQGQLAAGGSVPEPSGEPDPQEDYRGEFETTRLREWLSPNSLTPLVDGLRAVAHELAKR